MVMILDRREKVLSWDNYLQERMKDLGIHPGGSKGDDSDESGSEAVTAPAFRRNPSDSSAQHLTRLPHHRKLYVSQVTEDRNIQGLPLAILNFLRRNNSQPQTRRAAPAQQLSDIALLPLEYQYIDVWNHFKTEIPVVDDKYPLEVRTIRASGKIFDAVLVHDQEDANVAGLKGFRVAQVRLIFRAAQFTTARDQPLSMPLAYVEWFSIFKSHPEQDVGLYKVTRLFRSNGERQADVIELKSITRPCPLIPVYGTQAKPAIGGEESLDHYNSFYVNPFFSHLDYRCLF